MFYDRADAGEKLAKALQKYKDQPDTIVLGMPRGGVVTAKKVAEDLNLALDILITRKISAPGNNEYAIGAVASSGDPILNEEVIGTMGITPDYLDSEIIKQREEIKRRLVLYRKGRPAPNVKGKTVILVDDGIATGYSILAAVELLKTQKINKIIVAIPVAPAESIEILKNKVDDLICLDTPDQFFAVGQFYDQFDQISDEEVMEILNQVNNPA